VRSRACHFAIPFLPAVENDSIQCTFACTDDEGSSPSIYEAEAFSISTSPFSCFSADTDEHYDLGREGLFAADSAVHDHDEDHQGDHDIDFLNELDDLIFNWTA
jgi:hypothetical protein